MPFFDLLPLSVPLNRKISFISLVQICHPFLLPLSFLKPRDTDVHNCFKLHSSGLSLQAALDTADTSTRQFLQRRLCFQFQDPVHHVGKPRQDLQSASDNHIHSHEQTEEKPYFLSREQHLVAAWALFFTLIGSGTLM